MKRIIPVLLASSSLFSFDECCPPKDGCAKCAQIWPSNGPDWIITPGAGPCVAMGWDAHVSLDFIYWSTREDNLAFAIYEHVNPDGSVFNGKVLHPAWRFRPGFKVGIGILYDHDSWDFTTEYTWLRVSNTRKSEEIEDTAGLRLRPVGDDAAFADLTQPILSASAFWDLDFNVLDAELGRNFFISRYLKLRPHFGLKGTWQDQHYQVTASDETITSYDKNGLHYWGVGIRAGLDTIWHFNQCFSFLGDVAVTALWEKFEVERKSLPLLDIEETIHTLQPVLELFLGLRYENWLCCDRYHFSLDAGWELQWWGGQNQFFHENVESTCGNLSLNGLSLKGRLDF